jgi:hypothetical protein
MRPRADALPRTDPLARALARAAVTETDPAVKDWLKKLLKGDAEVKTTGRQSRRPRTRK